MDKDAAKRDEVARRLLRTPPITRQQLKAEKASLKSTKRTAGKGRARVGKSKSYGGEKAR